MVLVVLFVIISLWYIYETSYSQIPRQSYYAFVLMLIYMVIYLNIPYMKEYTFVQRYTYIFKYFPLITYYIILFPHSVVIPTKEFFPNLSDRLAIDATIILAWIGFFFMFTLLVGVNFFYQRCGYICNISC